VRVLNVDNGSERKSQASVNEDARLLLKVLVLFVPPTIAPYVFDTATHHFLAGLSLITGVLLQALIPPRRKGLLLLLGFSVVFAFAYSVFVKPS
jgi:hypothetical protein